MRGCGMSQRTFKIKRPQACALKIRPSLPGREAPPAGPDSPLLPAHTQGLRLGSPVPGPALSRCLEPGSLRSCCPERGWVSETAGGEPEGLARQAQGWGRGGKRADRPRAGEMGGRRAGRLSCSLLTFLCFGAFSGPTAGSSPGTRGPISHHPLLQPQFPPHPCW